MGLYTMSILPQKFESKIGSKEPKNRSKFIYRTPSEKSTPLRTVGSREVQNNFRLNRGSAQLTIPGPKACGH